MVSLALHGRISERTREQIEEVAVPQVAELCVAHFVALNRQRQCACPGACMFFLDLSLVF